jgi:hypothetical protein
MAKTKTNTAKKNGNGAKRAKVLTRSDRIAATWNDPAIRAARSERTAVRVKGVEYRSVADAFRDLDLPMGRCIRFRMALKASPTGRATFENEDGAKFQFSVVA